MEEVGARAGPHDSDLGNQVFFSATRMNVMHFTDSLRRDSSTLSFVESSVALMPLLDEGMFSKTPMLMAVLMAEFWAVWMMEPMSILLGQEFLGCLQSYSNLT